MPAFRNKLYLQMLFDDTCLLFLGAWDFCILSCMLETVYKIFTYCFLFFLYIPKVFLKKTLMFFAGYFLVARAVF